MKTLNAIALTLLAPGVASAMTEEAATSSVRSTVDKVVRVLSAPDLQGPDKRLERHAKLRAISDEVFDWGAMAQRSLGPHWRGLDAKQKTDFRDTFKELLAAHYLSQLDSFQGDERVEHKGTEKLDDGHKVKMLLVTQSRASVPIHFFMDSSGKVYDVAIEGVSLTNHYRGSFDRVLVNGSFDELMKRLEQKLAIQRRLEAKADKDDK